MDGVMEKPVSDWCFVNMATFRIMDEKRIVSAMPVIAVFQILMQFKNMILKTHFKRGHIFFVGLFFFEFRPSIEQILQRNNFFKHEHGQ